MFRLRVIQAPVTLNPDAIDANPLLLYHPHHSDYAVAFFGSPGIEVVIIKLCIRGVLARIAKGQLYQLIPIAYGINPGGGPVGAVIGNHLVDYIPCVYTARVTPRHRLNMLAHPFSLSMRRFRFAALVQKHPIRRLVMPYQRMTHDVHAVSFTKSHKFIRWRKIVNPRSGVNLLRFHYVLNRNAVELLQNNFFGERILTRGNLLVYRRTQQESVTVGLF